MHPKPGSGSPARGLEPSPCCHQTDLQLSHGSLPVEGGTPCDVGIASPTAPPWPAGVRPWGWGSEGWPPLTTGLGGGSAAFSSLNNANPLLCLPSVTNAPTWQVPYSSLLNNNKPHNMLLTYVRLLCDFCIVSISKCLHLPSVTNTPTRQVPYSSLLNNNKPHNMLLTYVRLLCDFSIVSISKCLCGCCFSKPLLLFNCDFCIVRIPNCLCFKAMRRFVSF